MYQERRIVANMMGWASILSNFPWWWLLQVSIAHPCPGVPHSDTTVATSVLVQALGLLLSVAAAFLGSRRWAFAAALPVASFFGGITMALDFGRIGPC